jgi:predicted esterase
MSLSESHIKFQKNGRFFTLGAPENGKELIIALHGYGYLAEYFSRKFSEIDLNKHVVVIPEGLHRFYHSGTSGRVGASWMTKEDREADIEDYISFLDTLLTQLKSDTNYSKITLLGFSQGGATASRWLAYGKHQFDKFILWATVFPPDMDKEYTPKFNSSSNYFVFGTNDEYYSKEIVDEHFIEMQKIKLKFQMLTFDGRHDIHTETLISVLNNE